GIATHPGPTGPPARPDLAVVTTKSCPGRCDRHLHAVNCCCRLVAASTHRDIGRVAAGKDRGRFAVPKPEQGPGERLLHRWRARRILTSLSRVADLKVISRTSVMQYKDLTKRNLREIGQQLGVANVVEGSVQRAGNRVRVNAQLIDARNDAHLWAQSYDGDLTDVFGIQ